MIKVGINGFGRIGSLAFRAAIKSDDIEVVAINAPGHPASHIAYCVKYDSVHGRFDGEVVGNDEDSTVTVNGKQSHGASPEAGVDAITIAAHIVTGLEELISREVSNKERSIVLTGKIYGGDSCNTQAGTCVLEVSVRAASAERRDFLKKRVKEISEGIALAFRGTADVEYVYGMPPMYNHPDMYNCVPDYIAEIVGEENVIELQEYGGTEDFTAVAEKVPSIYVNIGTGNIAGPGITHHNPKIIFDEDALPIGTAVYCQTAVRWLEEHQ